MRRAAHPWDRFYRQHEAPWRGERDLDAIRPWLGDGPVLELGAGNGKGVRPLLREGLQVVPLDISWHVMRRAGDGVVADAAKLPFEAGRFSAVLDVHCCGHLDLAGRQAALQEAIRVLLPDGHLIIERLGCEDLRATQGAPVPNDPGARILQDGRTTHFTDEGTLRSELQAAGLEVVAATTIRREPRHGKERVVREAVRVVARRPV